MSFGTSPSDIIIVVTFCRELYRKCRSAGGEYDEISREVRGLHTALKHLKSEIEDEDSPLNRDQSIWGKQLAPIIGDCDFTLKQLDGLLLKYGRLFEGNEGGNSSGKILWDKMRFGSNEMDQLGGIRVKLISHKTNLTLFLDTIQLHENGKMAKNLDVQGEQLDIILDKVDHIAAKMNQKAGTLMTSYEDDDEEVWKQFRRELISEGFSSDVLQQHKDILRAYIRQMEQDGLLVEEPLTHQVPSPVSPHTERWIDSTHHKSPRGQPSFDSINIRSDANGAKEMIQREDNVKFPTSMKLERPKPESRLDPYLERQPERQSTPSHRQLSPPLTPKISNPDLIEPERKQDTSGPVAISDTSSISRTRSPPNSSIIQTSDLLFLPFPATPQLLPPPSPSSYHSHEDETTRSIAIRLKQSDQGPSPRTSGVRFDLPDLPGRQPSPKLSTSVGTSPRPDSTMPLTRLAPDSYGNEIPSDAKWTKVKRSLISTEVLDQDGRRYEARPEFVAILGILTKEEIQDYASRSHILREERWRRHHQASTVHGERQRNERSSRTRRRRNSSSSESSSCSSDSTSDSDSDSDSNNDRGQNRRTDQDGRQRNTYNREGRRATRDERGDEERREGIERKNRDLESSYTFSPNSTSRRSPQPQPFSTSPHSGTSDTRPWNIPGSNQLPHEYPPPPLHPQQGYTQQPPYPMQNQQYTQAPLYPPPSQQYPPQTQYLSPGSYTRNPNSAYSPSSSPSTNPYTYPPSPNQPHSYSQSPNSHSTQDPNHNYSSHRRRHHSRRSRNRDRDSHAKSRDGGGMLGKAPTTGSRWRDHLTAAGLGGAAVGLLNVLSEAADGF